MVLDSAISLARTLILHISIVDRKYDPDCRYIRPTVSRNVPPARIRTRYRDSEQVLRSARFGLPPNAWMSGRFRRPRAVADGRSWCRAGTSDRQASLSRVPCGIALGLINSNKAVDGRYLLIRAYRRRSREEEVRLVCVSKL